MPKIDTSIEEVSAAPVPPPPHAAPPHARTPQQVPRPEGAEPATTARADEIRVAALLGITVVFDHEWWVAAAASRHALPSPGARLAADPAAGGLRAAVAAAGGRRAGVGPRTGRRGRVRTGPDRGRPGVEAGDRGAVHEGRPLRRVEPAERADAGARSAGPGSAPAHPGPQRGPRAPADGRLVRLG